MPKSSNHPSAAASRFTPSAVHAPGANAATASKSFSERAAPHGFPAHPAIPKTNNEKLNSLEFDHTVFRGELQQKREVIMSRVGESGNEAGFKPPFLYYATFFLYAMKIIWFAILLSFALIGLTAYVAWEANVEARIARKEVLMFREKQNEQLAAGARPAPTLLDSIAPPPPEPTPAVAPTSPPPPATDRATVSISPTPEPTPSALPPPQPAATPVPLTAQQSQLLALPAIAKVKEAFPNDGFVLIDAGSRKQLTAGMQFDIRRGAALIARVTLTSSIEENEAIADIQPRSLSPGVTPKSGDEIVQTTNTP